MRAASIACVAVLLALACAAHAAAPVLYGTNNFVQLITVDPTSGKISPAGQPLAYVAQAKGLVAMDAAHGVMFILGYNETTSKTVLVGIDVDSGRAQFELVLPFDATAEDTIGQALAYDPRTNEVIVVGHDPQFGDEHAVLRVNVTNGAQRVVATFAGFDALHGPSAYDPDTGALWVSAMFNDSGHVYGSLLGFDTETGKQLAQVQLKVSSLNYDSVTRKIFGLGFVVSKGVIMRTLVAIDPATGAAAEVGRIGDFTVQDADISALDAQGRRVVALMQPHQPAHNKKFNLVSIDLATAQVTTHPYACTRATLSGCPWSLAFLE